MPTERKILLVEDDKFMRELWINIIRQLNYSFHIEIAVSEAFANKMICDLKQNDQSFEVIICDIFLSGNKTGVDLWQTFKAEPSQFIFTSGVSEEKFKNLFSQNAKKYYFLQKPFLFEKGLNLLSTVLNCPI